jgi:hypothetical protein
VSDDLPDITSPGDGGGALPDDLPPPAGDDIRPDSFVATTGFLRAGDGPIRLPAAADGTSYTAAEADAAARRFFDLLAGERVLEYDLDDPVDHVRSNGLLLLYSDGVAELFETHLVAMPDDVSARWRDLIAGGTRSEAFGPLTLQERLDERQFDKNLVLGRRQRLVNSVAGVVISAVLVAVGWWAYQEFGVETPRERGALQFQVTDEPADVAALEGGPPEAEPALTAALNETVAILRGGGSVDDRVTTPPFAAYPFPPGSLVASLFQYAGAGHVVLIGPTGFADEVCLRTSVVTSELRPLDTVTHGPCVDPIGREPTIGCAGPTALLLALDIPAGQVDLPEGGTGLADAVRVQLIVDRDDEYEVLTQRATIAVDPASDVRIPRFGGAAGDDLTFDLGSGRVGTCTLTGDLP